MALPEMSFRDLLLYRFSQSCYTDFVPDIKLRLRERDASIDDDAVRGLLGWL